MDYPENHIEADNRLSWLLGRLDKSYGNSALYVHLKRNPSDTARSFAKRYSRGIMKAYRGEGILMGLPEECEPVTVALDYCETVNSNIELFLKDKTRKLQINLESIERDFTRFWEMIGAQGDMEAALGEFKTRYNASKRRQGLLNRIKTLAAGLSSPMKASRTSQRAAPVRVTKTSAT